MLSPQSQLLLRSADHFLSGRWAFINPTDPEIFKELDNPHILGFHQFYHHFEACQNATSQAQFFAPCFDIKHIDGDLLDGVVIYMPKSKQQLAMLIDNAASLLKANAVLLVVGENKAGIKSIPKLLEKVGTTVNKIDSAKHCGLYAVTIEQTKANFKLDSYSQLREYLINGKTISVYSLPGVFGHKQLDPGTDLLLQQLTPQALSKTKGHVYDFACGTGIIGIYLAKILESNKVLISMSDVSALAIYCANKTAQANNINADNISIEACDGLLKTNGKFDVIVSNPPFHDGIKNDYSITESFIRDAFSHSKQYANMTIVANKFLPYPEIFDAVYKGFKEVATSNKYKVYAATKFSQ